MALTIAHSPKQTRAELVHLWRKAAPADQVRPLYYNAVCSDSSLRAQASQTASEQPTVLFPLRAADQRAPRRNPRRITQI